MAVGITPFGIAMAAGITAFGIAMAVAITPFGDNSFFSVCSEACFPHHFFASSTAVDVVLQPNPAEGMGDTEVPGGAGAV